MERHFHSLAVFTHCLLSIYPGAWAIGINYGLLGDNLPPPANTISKLQQINANKIRIFSPDKDVLTALHNSDISVIIGTFNQELEQLANNYDIAVNWVERNILPHYKSVTITCIAAGNEVYPGDLAEKIPAAMANLEAALSGSQINIPVTTAVSMQVLSKSYPPSEGAFQDDSTPVMKQIVEYLSSKNSPLLVNIYPYFPRISDSTNIKLKYALFEEGDSIVRDGEYTYTNLFDAMTDAAYAALEKVGGSKVEIVVSETGWPSDGGQDASVENAKIYVNNLIEHVSSGKGTPRRPGKEIETYIFAMYNENQKPQGVEQHWGLYYPDLTEVYHVDHFN